MLKLMRTEWRFMYGILMTTVIWIYKEDLSMRQIQGFFTPFLQHVAYLKSPTMKMNNTIKNSSHLNVSKVPDWNSAIWILITLKLLSNSERLAIPYFLRFSYLPNNSMSVRQLANHLNSGRNKGKKRRLNKTRDVFCETCWVSISHLDVQKIDKKEASLFPSLLVLQFCLSPTTFTCRA